MKGKESGEPDLPSSEASGDLGEVRPAEMPDLMPKAGDTKLDYDNEMRLISVTDAAGATSTLAYDATGRTTETDRPLDAGRRIVEKAAYDRNGNMRQSEDARGHKTTTVYDGFDRPVERSEPGSADNRFETTKLTYDANDQVVREQTPRGVASGDATAYVKRMTYDRVDRMTTETNPAGERTSIEYDRNGNRASVTSPQGRRTSFSYDPANQKISETDNLNQTTTYAYDQNGNQIEEKAPGASSGPNKPVADRVTKRTFDGRDLPWTETTFGDETRTKVTEFDPNGNLRREVNPAGVDEGAKLPLVKYGKDADLENPDTDAGRNADKDATVRDYRPDDILKAVHQPWGDDSASDKKRYVQRFEHSDRGFVTAIVAPHAEADDADKTQEQRDTAKRRRTTTYEHFDTGWIKKQTDPEYERPENKRQTIVYDYLPTGHQRKWDTPGKRTISREYYPSGKLERRTATGQSGSDRRYAYAYNENGTLTRARDEDKGRTTLITPDAAERELLVDEAWDLAGTERDGKDTAFRYDRDGEVTRRQTDGKWRGSGTFTESDDIDEAKTARFTLDGLGRETQAEVDPEHGQNRITKTSYHPSGEREHRRRNELSDGDPAVIESTYHYADGRMSCMQRRKRGQGSESTPCPPPGQWSDALEKNRTYTYDRNGNRRQDERGTYDFNARDQVTKWSRGGSAKTSGSVDYTLDGSGSMRSQTDSSGASTSYGYDGDRLMSSSTSGGQGGQSSQDYTYDDFGATTSISGGAGGGSTGMDYDEFGRMKKGSGPDGKTVCYTYDALDRRDTKVELGSDGECPASDTTTGQDMSYVGSSESLSEETGTGKDRSYDYTSDMERLGQASGDGAESEYKGYAKDANGSVEGLENDDGQVDENNKYSYDPYGEPEKQMGQDGQPQDPEASLGEAAKGNPFRYEGFYQDSAIKSYDMQARPYRPEVGRFLTQDRFEESQGDFELQSDPLTQNRYAFAGGNPVNNVEWDGHHHCGVARHETTLCAVSVGVQKADRQAQGFVREAGRKVLEGAKGSGKTLADQYKGSKLNEGPLGVGGRPSARRRNAERAEGLKTFARNPVGTLARGTKQDFDEGRQRSGVGGGLGAVAGGAFGLGKVGKLDKLAPEGRGGGGGNRAEGKDNGDEASGVPSPTPNLRGDVRLSGGRGGGKVKNLTGPSNSVVRGGPGRAFQTNDKGEVISDITQDRVKPVSPGQGFGAKRAPTDQESAWVRSLWDDK